MRFCRAARTSLFALVALLAGLSVLGAPSASSDSQPSAIAAQSSKVARGSLDADVRNSKGRRLGELHGSIHAGGRGKATFQPVAGSRLLSEVVGLRVRSGGRVVARADGLRLTLRITRRNRLSGKGRIAGRRVRVRGAGGERALHLSARKRMLVVGRPRGEAYDALKRRYRTVRYSKRRHARHRLLRGRREFRRYAAVVFGKNVSTAAIRRHHLLHTFYSSGRYVILTQARPNRLAAASRLHPFVVTRASSALVLRARGAEGATKRTRHTVVYPAPIHYPKTYTVRTSDGELVRQRVKPPSRRALLRNKQRRQRWFLRELSRKSRAYALPARASQGDPPINVPSNAAMLEIPVSFYHEHQTVGSRGMSDNPMCGWNRGTSNAWCPDTWFWKQQSDAWGDPYTACLNFRNKKYTMVNQSAVNRSNGLNGDGAYTLKEDDVKKHVLTIDIFNHPQGGNGCAGNWSTTQVVQGTDTYYAMYSANPDTHIILVQEDVTITPTSNLGGAGGSYVNGVNGGASVTDCTTSLFGCTAQQAFPFRESHYLGRYDRTIALSAAETSGPSQFVNPEFPDQDNRLVYSGGKSVPGTTIQQTEQTSGEDHSVGFDIGIFGDQGTAGYNSSTSTSFSATVTVPDWVVSPIPAHRQISWQWKNNHPVNFDTAFNHQTSRAGQTFAEANDLNNIEFTPESLAVWSGPPVWGRVSVDSNRTLYMVDHFTFFNQANNSFFSKNADMIEDRYGITQSSLADGPSADTPDTGSRNDALSPGINFCDPEIRAPAYKDTCANAYAVSITLTAKCPSTGSFSGISVNGQPMTGADGKPTSTLTCGATAHTSPKPKSPATVTATWPTIAKPRIACVDPSTSAGLLNSISPIILTTEQMTPKRHIACTVQPTN